MTERAFPLRLAVGLGHLDRERALLPALCDSGEFSLAARCLAADDLVDQLRPGAIDVALVAADVHRLTDEMLATLCRSRIPLVLLADTVDGLPAFRGATLPYSAAVEDVRVALRAAAGTVSSRVAPSQTEPEPPGRVAMALEDPQAAAASGNIIAVWSGPGERWRTRLAVELATGLGAVDETILVDADLAGPSVHVLLDADPTRNLITLLHADPRSARDWDRAIAAEAQALHSRSGHGVVLCGLAKPEGRGAVSPASMEQLIVALAGRYRYVVLDVGADTFGDAGAAHRTALRLANRVLLAASPDLLGLWQARTALRCWRDQLHLGEERLALVLAGHDPRHHHTWTEIGWTLSVPVAAVIPHDHQALHRALAEQRPLTLDTRRPVAHALLDLANRLRGGEIILPPEPLENPRTRRGALSIPHWRWPHVSARSEQKGTVDGDSLAAVP